MRSFVTTKSLFFISILVAVLTILAVWLSGLGKHRGLFVNSLADTSILSLTFFLFLFVNLYRGVRMKDNLGKITDNIQRVNFPDLTRLQGGDFANVSLDAGEGCGEILLGIVVWIFAAIILLVLIWLFGTLLWILILIFAAMLYWIFFRALRLVFKRSAICKGDLSKSANYALLYTLLYTSWIFGIILASHYLL